MSIKEDCERAVEFIESCFDENQEQDENGRPVDGLSFDERLEKRRSEVKDHERIFKMAGI